MFLKSICKNAGADKDDFDKVVGTHWSMKVWKDGQSWGSHISCKELPDMDCLETFTEGEEKSVDHALFGGKGKEYVLLISISLNVKIKCIKFNPHQIPNEKFL